MLLSHITYNILLEVNAKVWGGVEGVEKAGKVVKTGLSGADVIIGTSHAFEDFGCNDIVCLSLNIIGGVASTVGLIIGIIFRQLNI